VPTWVSLPLLLQCRAAAANGPITGLPNPAERAQAEQDRVSTFIFVADTIV
jgi:hypothetical protein